jgi:PAS domain S-box-containing protein
MRITNSMTQASELMTKATTQTDLHSGQPMQHVPSEIGIASNVVNPQNFLEAMLVTSEDCIKVLDLTGSVLFINHGGVTAMELASSTEIVGQSWFTIWKENGREAAMEGVAQAKMGIVSQFVGEADTAKGTPRSWHVTVAPILTRNGTPDRILVKSRDISQSRAADRKIANLMTQALAGEEELRTSEAKFRAIADTMPQMVWSTLPDGFHDYYNARWYKFTGVPVGSTDGEGWNDMFHPDDRDRALQRWKHSLATGEPYEIEYRLRHNSGVYRWTLGRALPISDESGAIIRWFGTCTDIHASKQDAEMLALLGQELSHRIKNIFAILQGLISLSARRKPEVREFAEGLRERVAALGRAHDFARPHSDESRPIVEKTTLHALLGEILKPYPAMDEQRILIEGVNIEVDDKSATPVALMIHELATNAMKYGALSSPNGRILIVTSEDKAHCVIKWSEDGGPRIEQVPKNKGFGTQLTSIAVDSQLGGTIERVWEPGGLVVTIRCPLSALQKT